MEDFSMKEMCKMQKALQEKYKDIWEPLNINPHSSRKSMQKSGYDYIGFPACSREHSKTQNGGYVPGVKSANRQSPVDKFP